MLFNFMFQDSCSPLMSYIAEFHDNALVIVLMIVSMVFYIMLVIIWMPCINLFFSGNEMLEIIWTILPTLVLGMLAIPSLYTLYMIDEVFNPSLSIKAIGHQWFWSYEYSDFQNLSFDSYMIPTNDLSLGEFRLLETSNNLIAPALTEIRLLITSDDVIHSWTIPSMGIKVDAVPGRLNQLCLCPTRAGLFYGQCSEICGSLHSFMPICLEIVPSTEFVKWLNN
nr:cytochrome c oxidase subunit 2 [Fulicoffula longipila]